MLTMLLGGLWHGAGWNFVIWGGLHGLALVVHREAERSGILALVPRAVRGAVGLPATFAWVCLAWIFFRATTFEGAVRILRAWLLFESEGPRTFGLAPIYTFLGLAAVHALGRTHVTGKTLERLPGWAFAVVYGALFPLALCFVNGSVQPFIYFQF